MELTAGARLLLIYAHLLLCVFALHSVLSTDWRLLRWRISAQQLGAIHGRVTLLLAGLWASGLAVAAIDVGFDLAELGRRPKLLAKLACVAVLTFNGVLLHRWCLPRLVSAQPLGRVEASALMVCGAVSTSSWLVAAFFGIAAPLQRQGWSLGAFLALYGLLLAAATAVALVLAPRLRLGPTAGTRQGAQPAAPVVHDAAPASGSSETFAARHA